MTVDQYKVLLKAIPEINATLKRGGINVGDTELPDDDEDEDKPQKKTKAKKEKSNIEETSDEDNE